MISLRCASTLSCGVTFASLVILCSPRRSPQPIITHLVLFAEPHDVASVDALVHQLGDIGRRQVSFLGERPDAPPQCIVGMCPISRQTVTRLTLIQLGCGGLGLLADFIAHDCTAPSSRCRTAWMGVLRHASPQLM